MTTAMSFLAERGMEKNIIKLCSRVNYNAVKRLAELLDEYHAIKMREAGFSKDDNKQSDTIKT